MKREAWNHPKIKILCRDLKLPLCYVNGILESLWLVTGQSLPAGDIGRWSNEEIAAAIEYPGDADELVAALLKRRLLDPLPESDGRLYVHDWHEHCDQAVKRKLSRWKQSFANGVEIKWRVVTSHNAPQSSHSSSLTRYSTSQLLQPEPEPEPEPEPTTIRAVGSEFPKTAAAVRVDFPAADDVFAVKLVQETVQKVLSANGCVKCDPDDAMIADAVRECHTKKQTSAGLYLKTVPQCVLTWVTQGRNDKNAPPSPLPKLVPYDPFGDARREREARENTVTP